MVASSSRRVLGDYFTLQRGTTYKSRLLGLPGPVLLGLATIQRNGGFRRDSLQTYGGDSPDKLLVHPGDLYLSLKDVTQSADLLGAVARLPQDHPPGRLTQDTVKLEPKASDVPLDYLHWLLRTPQYRSYCSSHATGTTNLGLARDDFLAFPAPEPSPKQLAIVDTLTGLDDKIELIRRMNETLEAMARALFKSWFVDFDPVRAKAESRDLDLPKAIANLFPDSLEDSEIGQVPKGWRVEPFSEHLTAERGLSYKGEGLREDEGGIPMHNLNSVYEGGGYKHEGIKYYDGDYREKHLLKPGDMIVTNTEQGFDHLLIGHAAIVPECYGPKGIFSHHLYRVRHKPSSPFGPHYLVELFNNPRWHSWISGFSNGTTINMLPMDALELPLLVVPPVELVNKFMALAEAAHLQIEANKQQSRTLAALRDALLPKLISGELRVNEAEKGIEATA